MTTKRDVFIERVGPVWMVKYCQRTKYKHYSPVQFDANHTTLEQVKKWVDKNPKLRLMEAI